jgi:thioredoxin 1
MMNRQNLPVIFLSLLVLILLAGYVFKGNINRYISEKMRVTSGNNLSVEKLIDERYNYLQNGEQFDFTLLEFGSKGCAVCKQMETVLEEISNCCSDKINVVFINTMYPENQALVKHFGISAIPIQVLLDKQGREFFRNYGFISAGDLKDRFNATIL